ncbi:uncharacterized protein EV420DRAFT_1644505 [Desarmillaria tabescens]|uniref:Uncharacterized protein n=1 Tax=Armillaria tabescens TaxID=1929756 RepID=A0AA39K743_ARMTA|nr:uncharacterized protein EV420DRAFT_1644505 [Desarmillaria tabescens]KAK0455725.1 hypothetical protein EV420DRAFT_1644505 [Desarmillaria tabescens]
MQFYFLSQQIITKYYPWWIYFVLVLLLLRFSRETKDIVFGSLGGFMFPGLWTTLKYDAIARDIALKVHLHHVKRKELLMVMVFAEIILKYVKMHAYIEDQRVAIQTSTVEADSFRLCSSTVTQQCLVSKQKAEALYSAARTLVTRIDSSVVDLHPISLDLDAQALRIQAIVENYFAFRVSLAATAPQDQLQAAQQWVDLVNTVYPPVAADPVNEHFLCLDEEATTVPS